MLKRNDRRQSVSPKNALWGEIRRNWDLDRYLPKRSGGYAVVDACLPKIHIVADGETIEQIARFYATTPEAIIDRNCIDRACTQHSRLVVAGQRLVIPVDHYTVGLFWL